jgi:hypothetical protein
MSLSTSAKSAVDRDKTVVAGVGCTVIAGNFDITAVGGASCSTISYTATWLNMSLDVVWFLKLTVDLGARELITLDG